MVLHLRGVTKTYETGDGPLPVLRGVDLALNAGETLALTGESGSGKSTLLHLVGGLDMPDAGVIEVAGADITVMDDEARAVLRRGTVGVVFQQFNLIPALDVGANLSFQARLAGRHEQDWCAELAERLGLHPFLRRYPEQLSGGQQQRVAIGRALAARPQLLLADEPTGNLDETTAEAVLTLMLELVRASDTALLMVTHSDRVADRMARRVHLRMGQVA